MRLNFRVGRVVAMQGCAAVLASISVTACASPGVPPGGPPDTAAPQVLRIVPDSGRSGTTPREVIFRFDEVVSERPTGAASLDALFLISPREASPVVDWNRDEVAIRPRRGWRRNTTYTVTMLPGMTDNRGNVRNTGAVTTFSTGSSIPQSRISGRIFDWATGLVATRALVEAVSRPDTSLIYVAAADSLGQFSFPHLAPGAYTVRGFLDENSNRGIDSREAWDSVAVTLTDNASVELLAFVHDSIGSRISAISIRDSVTLDLSFDGPFVLQQPASAATVSVTAADSTRLPIVSVAPPAADTVVRAAGDTSFSVPRPSKPVPPRTLIVKLGTPLLPGTEYRVRAADIRNLVGVIRSSERTVTRTVPAVVQPLRASPTPAPAPPTPAPVRR
ncbi:MAG: Ig-like domain-containing protein [Gemmatimonadaceae bacterium]